MVFCWKPSSETKSLSQGNAIKSPSSSQPLFVSADFLKYNAGNSSLRQKAINMIICLFHSPVYHVYVPQRSNSFKRVHWKYFSLSLHSDWRRTTLTSVRYLEMYCISGPTVSLTVSVIVSVIKGEEGGGHICLVNLAEHCKKSSDKKKKKKNSQWFIQSRESSVKTSKVSQGHASPAASPLEVRTPPSPKSARAFPPLTTPPPPLSYPILQIPHDANTPWPWCAACVCMCVWECAGSGVWNTFAVPLGE